MDIKTEKILQNLDERSQITIKLTGAPDDTVSMLRSTTSGIVPPMFGIGWTRKMVNPTEVVTKISTDENSETFE